jgi:collagenase-like PrtC family protease
MRLLVEPSTKDSKLFDINKSVILSLEDYSVHGFCYFTMDEIIDIKNKYKDIEIFVSLNKNFLNHEVEGLKDVLIKLNEIGVSGVFFYDLVVLQLKKELNLDINLVWNQTHMVNNYKTCNYYHSKGVKYALLGKEITLEEIIEIIKNSTITSMVEVLGLPSVAFSKRKLITNYYKDLNKESKDSLDVLEKVTSSTYHLTEDENGTSFFLKEIINGTSVIKDLYNNGLEYIIMRGYGIEEELFKEILTDRVFRLNLNRYHFNKLDIKFTSISPGNSIVPAVPSVCVPYVP